LKFAINITRQPNRLTNRHRSSRSEPFCLSWVLPLVYPSFQKPGISPRCSLLLQRMFYR